MLLPSMIVSVIKDDFEPQDDVDATKPGSFCKTSVIGGEHYSSTRFIATSLCRTLCYPKSRRSIHAHNCQVSDSCTYQMESRISFIIVMNPGKVIQPMSSFNRVHSGEQTRHV